MSKYAMARAQGDITATSLEAQKYIRQLGSRCTLLESAIKVLMKHDLLNEWTEEHGRESHDVKTLSQESK